MKEDILEQITEDWLISQPSTFTKSNIKFKPDKNHSDYSSKADNNYSDIDILAVHLDKSGMERVSVVSCKSWQTGFDPGIWMDKLCDTKNHSYNKDGKIKNWRYFRELIVPKWTRAFVDTIKLETKQTDFTYYVAATNILGDRKKEFENCNFFIKNFKDQGAGEVKIIIKPFSEMFTSFFSRNNKQTLEPTLVGRLLQIIKASDLSEDNLKQILNNANNRIMVKSIKEMENEPA